MKHFTNWRTISLASAFLVAASTMAMPAQADQWNKRTVMTVDKPILVPRTQLPAGTYVIKLLNSQSERHVVEIFNADESHLITTILAIPNYRLAPTGKSSFSFWETPAGDPPALRAWFYPGDNYGQEFAYPRDMVAKLSALNKGPVPSLTPSTEPAQNSTATANAATPPAATPDTQAEVTPPVSQPNTEAMATPPVQAEQQPATPPQTATQPPAASTPTTPSTPPTSDADRTNPSELPQTATDYPAIALAGFASLAAFGLLSLFAKRRQTNS